MMHTSQQSTPRVGSTADIQSPKDLGQSKVTTSVESLATHSFPTAKRITVDELSEQARLGNQKAKMIAAVLPGAFFGALATSSLVVIFYSKALTFPSAITRFGLVVVVLYTVSRSLIGLCNLKVRYENPQKLLNEAKANGSFCDQCEYPLFDLEIPKCPECGKSAKSLESKSSSS